MIDAPDPGRNRFVHVLIGEVLVGGLSATRRLRLHRDVGAALERVFAGRIEPRLAELAYHFLAAAPAGDVEQGLRYAAAAAELASVRLAYEEAAQMYERALRALDRRGSAIVRRCGLRRRRDGLAPRTLLPATTGV